MPEPGCSRRIPRQPEYAIGALIPRPGTTVSVVSPIDGSADAQTSVRDAGNSVLPMEAENGIPRELARRCECGLDVQLVWEAADDAVFLAVTDTLNDEQFIVRVPPEEALDAYNHPFVRLVPATPNAAEVSV